MERVMGQPYEQYVSKHILAPLGMGSSGFNVRFRRLCPSVCELCACVCLLVSASLCVFVCMRVLVTVCLLALSVVVSLLRLCVWWFLSLFFLFFGLLTCVYPAILL